MVKFDVPYDLELRAVAEKYVSRCVENDHGCLIYPVKAGSYVSARVAGKFMRGHRLVWSAKNGPIPEGLWTIDHLCYERRCLNVQHFELVTMMENSRRGIARWRN